MKKTKKKAFALITALALIMTASSVLPTVSWLTAQSDVVVNTFAGGAISLVLDEAEVDGNGKAVGEDRVTENSYRIIPGTTLDKDPTVTVLSGSDVCFVFLYVDSMLSEEYFTMNYSSEWIRAAESDSGYLYVYMSVVDAAGGDVVLPAIFTQVSISEELTSETILALGELTLKVQAYAVQSDGISYSEALSMAEGYFCSGFGVYGFTDSSAETDFETESGIENPSVDETDTEEETSDNTMEDDPDDETSAESASYENTDNSTDTDSMTESDK